MVERQSYILPASVEAMKETITEKGITNKHILSASEKYRSYALTDKQIEQKCCGLFTKPIFRKKMLEIYQLIITNHNEKTSSLSVFILKSLYSPLDTFSQLAVYCGLIYQHLNYSVEIWEMEILEPVLPLNYRKG